MTDRIIVATFNDTNAAYDAASAIKKGLVTKAPKRTWKKEDAKAKAKA